MPNISTEMREALALQASDRAKERIDSHFEKLCVELVSDWLLGDRRFESVSQQAEHWLSRLYEEIYVDEQPEATRLYERFRLPLPRARYIARLLMAQRAAQWRTAARNELKSTLDAFRDSAKEAIAAREGPTQRYEASLSRGAYDELMVTYDEVCRELASAKRPAPPRKLPSSPVVTWFSITADTLLAILDAL